MHDVLLEERESEETDREVRDDDFCLLEANRGAEPTAQQSRDREGQ
jgi:hypothetical protein